MFVLIVVIGFVCCCFLFLFFFLLFFFFFFFGLPHKPVCIGRGIMCLHQQVINTFIAVKEISGRLPAHGVQQSLLVDPLRDFHIQP